MEQKINGLIQQLVEKYGTENFNAALAAQALATVLGEDEQTLFEMIESEEPEAEDEDEATE